VRIIKSENIRKENDREAMRLPNCRRRNINEKYQ
jgi:hypothetical protein